MSTAASRETAKKQAPPPLFSDRPDDGFIRERHLLLVISFSASTLWRRIRAGTFPKPVKLGERAIAWKVGEIREWLAEVGEQKAIH